MTLQNHGNKLEMMDEQNISHGGGGGTAERAVGAEVHLTTFSTSTLLECKSTKSSLLRLSSLVMQLGNGPLV